MGRLTGEPELRTTSNAKAVVNFTLACDRDYEKDATDFVKIVAWRNTAEFFAKHFHKGMLVTVHGALHNKQWTDSQGNKRDGWCIEADTGYFAESKKQGQQKADTKPDIAFDEIDEDDEELPF